MIWRREVVLVSYESKLLTHSDRVDDSFQTPRFRQLNYCGHRVLPAWAASPIVDKLEEGTPMVVSLAASIVVRRVEAQPHAALGPL